MTNMTAQEWTVLNPVADASISGHEAAVHSDDLRGRRVGLWWNGKPNGDIFLNELAAQLEIQHPGMQTVRMWELEPATTTFYGVPRDKLEFMARGADLVIGALGD